jgi:hypothetical protein
MRSDPSDSVSTAVTAHHEDTKDHEDHKDGFVQKRLRGFRVSSILRDKPSSLAFVAALGLISCGRTPAAAPPPPNQAVPATSSPATGSALPHGDHNPHHGGVVMMKGDDLHYEVILDPSGGHHRVYFTDAVREELPASVASEVVLTVKRPSAPDERIVLQIDDAGESWEGQGRPVVEPASATARLAFTIRHEPYWIDLPFGSRQ